MRSTIKLGEYTNFDLEKTVCNHGFFMMAPNLWIRSTKSLIRPLRIPNHSEQYISSSSYSSSSSSTTATATISVVVSISQLRNLNSLQINVLYPPLHKLLSFILPEDLEQHIFSQVRRMLHLSLKDERDIGEFQRLHPEARNMGFGRLFRSPNLFEDVVKSLLLCNCSWTRTLQMAQALCDLQRKLNPQCGPDCTCKNKVKKETKRKNSNNTSSNNSSSCSTNSVAYCRMGNFPSPQDIACLDEETLNKHCNLGYRARYILKLANDLIQTADEDDGGGKLKVMMRTTTFDRICSNYYECITVEELYSELQRIKGVGPFTCANVMMCLGFYHIVPVDTETVKHLEEVHGRKTSAKAIGGVIEEIYGKYAPFQCLAYWFERVAYYESKFGKLSELPHADYGIVTGSTSQ